MKASHLKVVELHGGPRDQGLTYGRAVPDLIRKGIERWKTDLSASHIDVTRYRDWLSNNSPMAHAVRKLAPDYHQFVSAIAEGAVVPFEDVMGLSLIDEDFWARRYNSEFKTNPQSEISSEKCTTLAGRLKRGGWFSAQNQDIDYEGSQVLLHFMPDTGMERYIYTIGGMTGLCGMNAAGVSVSVNLIKQLNHNPNGLSVAGIVFGALEKPNLEEASQFVKSIPHASGQAYTLAGNTGIIGFEGSSIGAHEYPKTERGHYAHTNHPLLDVDLRAVEPGMSKEQIQLTVVGPNTQARYEQAKQMLDQTDAHSIESITEILSDRRHPRFPISCQHGDDGGEYLIGYSLGSMIALAPNDAPPEFHLASGPPSLEPYRHYAFQS